MQDKKTFFTYLLPLVGFSVFGAILIATSFADSNSVAFESAEAETANISTIQDDEASDRSYLQFGSKTNFATIRSDTVVKVSDFGATINDESDDTQAINDALAAIKPTGGTLEFETGTYNISGQTERADAANGADRFYEQMFRLNDFHNVHIKGNQTVLSATNWAGVFFMQNSSDIIISGFTVDWSDDLPFTAGEILEITDEHVDIRVAAEHPVRESSSVDYFIEWDAENNRPPKDGYRVRQPNTPTNCTVLDDESIRCTKAVAQSPMEVGDDIVVSFKKNGHDFAIARKTDGLALDDLTVYSQPGLVLSGAGRTRDVKVSNTYIGRKPGSNLALSASAGATNNAAMETRGELLQVDSMYKNTEDDGANTGNLMMKITNVIDETDIVVKYVNPVNFIGDGTRMPFNGDVLAFGSESDPFVDSSFGVVSNTRLLEDGYRLALRDGTDGLAVGDIVRNNSAAPLNSVFRNLTIEEGNAHGIRVHSKNVLIENSSFARIQGPQIISEIFLEPFAAGIVTENLFILNNEFDSGNFGRSKKTGAIHFVAKDNGVLPSAPIFNNVNICGNTFKNTENKAIHLELVNEAFLGGNTYDIDDAVSIGEKNANINATSECRQYERAHHVMESRLAEPLIPTTMVDVEYQGSSALDCEVKGAHDQLFTIRKSSDMREYVQLDPLITTTDDSSQADAENDRVFELCVRTDYGNDRVQEKHYEIEFIAPA